MSCFGNEPYSGEKKKQTDKDKTELISSIILNLLLYNTACILKWSDLSQGALSSQILATSRVIF